MTRKHGKRPGRGGCLAAVAVAVITLMVASGAEGASRCLVIFIGGWLDHKTELIEDLWKENQRIFGCQTKYHGYTDQNKIEVDIRRFRNANQRGEVIVIGHSLGGATALVFADEGADYVVTLDAYYPTVDSVIGGIFYHTIGVPIRVMDWVISLFYSRTKFKKTYWIFIEAEHRRICNNEKAGLDFAELAGSGPIDRNDMTLYWEPDYYAYCNNCDHCDVREMFAHAQTKLKDRF